MKMLIVFLFPIFLCIGCTTKPAPVIQLTPEQIRAAEIKEKEEERIWRAEAIKSYGNVICEELKKIKACEAQLVEYRKEYKQYGRIISEDGLGPGFWKSQIWEHQREIADAKEEYYKLSGRHFNVKTCR